MIYYFYGKDWFLTKLEADKKVSELLGQGFKKVFLTSLSELKEAVKSNSLFSDKKVFVFMTEKLNESEKKEFQKRFPAHRALESFVAHGFFAQSARLVQALR